MFGLSCALRRRSLTRANTSAGSALISTVAENIRRSDRAISYCNTGTENRIPPNKRYASSSVQITLAAWARRKAPAGRPPSMLTNSVKRVSRPMQVKARPNQTTRRPASVLLVELTVASSRKNEKITEAIRNPRTNLGKRSQMTPALGRSPFSAPFLNVHQTDIRKAAMPIKTFCENFTMTPAFIAGSLMSAPAATTEPLVKSSSQPGSRHNVGHVKSLRRPWHEYHHRDGDD